MPLAVLVVGPPRSGTSMVSGLLHAMGVNMGDRLIPGDKMNPTGFYVDAEFNDLLASEFSAMNMPDERGTMSPALDAAVRELIVRRESRGVDWGVKTTFGCVLIRPMLDICKDVRVVRTRRSVGDSCASLTAHTDHPQEKIDAIVRWFDHAAANCSAMTKSFEVNFEEMRANPKAGVTALAKFVGRNVDTKGLAAFVDPPMRTY